MRYGTSRFLQANHPKTTPISTSLCIPLGPIQTLLRYAATFFFAIAVPPHVVGTLGSSGAIFSRA
jgi:hypothetical protein